jgi:hypothetical protein
VPLNHAPNAEAYEFNTAADTPVRTPDLRLNADPDGDPLVIESFTQPTNGVLVYNNDGTFTYMPNPDFTGTDTFTYLASDDARWNRYRDFVPGPVPGTSEGNPSPDQFGNPVWSYEYAPVANALASPPSWYTLDTTSLVWDDAWYSGDGQWVFSDNTAPDISSGGMLHHAYYYWNYVPVVRWINPLPNPAYVDMRGGFTLIWTGDGGVTDDVPIDVVIVLVHAGSGEKQLLMGRTCEKPIHDTTRNVLLLPVRFTAVPVAPDDAIFWSLRVARWANGYMSLGDSGLTLAPSGSRSTSASTVNINLTR